MFTALVPALGRLVTVPGPVACVANESQVQVSVETKVNALSGSRVETRALSS